MAQRETPGQFEQLVLTAILTLGEDAYGVSTPVSAAMALPVLLGIFYWSGV
jgi:hypothetical protein